MNKQEQTLEAYLHKRWRALSKKTKEVICKSDLGLTFTQLLWTKQYWESRARKKGEKW